MKASNIILALLIVGAVYYFTREEKAKEEIIDPNDVSKWDDNKLNKYLIECCEEKKKGIVLGTHSKPELMDAAKKEAQRRGLSIPKCLNSSVDNIDQSFVCPKCVKSPCKCKKVSIGDMLNKPRRIPQGRMNKCGEGKVFINGICMDRIAKTNPTTTTSKIVPPEMSYAFPKYVNPLGEGYTPDNA